MNNLIDVGNIYYNGKTFRMFIDKTTRNKVFFEIDGENLIASLNDDLVGLNEKYSNKDYIVNDYNSIRKYECDITPPRRCKNNIGKKVMITLASGITVAAMVLGGMFIAKNIKLSKEDIR